MFDFFKKREYPELVQPKEPVPYVEPERQYYSLGPTTENRVMLKVYYGNISMDAKGIDDFIKVLESSKIWCEQNEEEENE